jgi:hypothetical protein
MSLLCQVSKKDMTMQVLCQPRLLSNAPASYLEAPSAVLLHECDRQGRLRLALTIQQPRCSRVPQHLQLDHNASKPVATLSCYCAVLSHSDLISKVTCASTEVYSPQPNNTIGRYLV